jgi:hypothetical protein
MEWQKARKYRELGHAAAKVVVVLPVTDRTGLHGLLHQSLFFLYVDDIPTSQETHLWAFKACLVFTYFTFLQWRTFM